MFRVLRYLAAIPLLLCFLMRGTGGLARLHDLQHAAEDAAHAAAAEAAGQPHHEAPHHDTSNCDLHAQFQLPVIASSHVPLLVCLGLFVTFLTLLPSRLVAYHALARIDCRGPPAC